MVDIIPPDIAVGHLVRIPAIAGILMHLPRVAVGREALARRMVHALAGAAEVGKPLHAGMTV